LTRTLSPPWATVIAITAVFAVICWSGVEQFKSTGGDDELAFRSYVDNLYANHRLPTRNENDEFSLPPGVPAIGVALTWAFKPIVPGKPSPIFQGLPRLLRRLLWIALVAGGAALLMRAPPLSPRFLIGAGAWLAAGVLAWTYMNTAVDNEAWLPAVLVDLVAAVSLVPLTAWLAHEVWPAMRWAPAFGAFGTTLLPPVFAGSLYFHPDPPFAALAALATVLVVRATRTGLKPLSGVAAGVAFGLAALTRQSAIVVAVALLGGVAVIFRRSAVRYIAVAGVTMAVVAGAWWIHQIDVYGNPFQSNLERQGYMLDHQPRSFYVSLPSELVTRPHYYHFENKLLPRFHAYLWADWHGDYHDAWNDPKPHARTLASIQSVLGFGGDALVLGGIVLFGLPALWRRRNAALAILTSLFVLAWAAYVFELIRFPQKGGDPIKAHYLLFLAPVAVVFAIASGTAMARRQGWQRALVYAWVGAYTVSWVLTLATAF
jgi:hypothetical protein